MDSSDPTVVEALETPNKLFLSGPFGSGKTTLAIERIRALLRRERTRGDDILVLVPQRSVARPYEQALRGTNAPLGPPVRITTVAGLALSSVQLYWPLVAGTAGFADPNREPVFLNLETSQYYMAQFVDEALERGEFDAVRVERSRVITQVLDNMNKAALNGFSIEEAYRRLELAVPAGEQHTARLNALRAAQRISSQFRELCLRSTLVDFSLQMELFNRSVLQNQWSRTHLFRSCRHLIADNVEEGSHTGHNLIRSWLPHLESALLIADDDAGFRIFLGAAPAEAYGLAAECDRRIHLDRSHTIAPELQPVADHVRQAIRLPPTRATATHTTASGEMQPGIAQAPPQAPSQVSSQVPPLPTTIEQEVVKRGNGHADGSMNGRDPADSFSPPETSFRFYPQMLEWVVEKVHDLINEEGVQPGEIAILAPFFSDALRFSLQTGLDRHDIPSTTHRPSRALQSEPPARALLTLAKLAHPEWGMRPAQADVALALSLAIARLDPIRAHLLTQIVFPARSSEIGLGQFGRLVPAMQERITYALGEAYDALREWLYAYRGSGTPEPLDQFLARLFGEVLSQPSFGFHADYDAARVTNQLVASARNFRWAQSDVREKRDDLAIGREYVRLVESGAIGALFLPGWREPDNAVFLAPAYTFLMRNRTVKVQFWLDVGSQGWWERLLQPLTHPYVLSHSWPKDALWTDYDEYIKRQETLRKLLLGLLHRASGKVYLGISDFGESGFEQRGPLLGLINYLLAKIENPSLTGVSPGFS